MWGDGAHLDEHTKRKHKILREYFREYLITRCKHPRREKFRLAIVDGFAGGGKYGCGSPGSPLILLETLKNTYNEINIYRATNNMRPIEIECFILLNDAMPGASNELTKNCANIVVEIQEHTSGLHLNVEYTNADFEELYPKIKAKILSQKHKNVLFNLDQYGYSDVKFDTLEDIQTSWPSAESFLTFSIETLKTFLSPDAKKNSVLNGSPKIQKEIYSFLEDGGELINKKTWMGFAEKVVFERLKRCATFVSPFSINNPDGWRYWLLHFANRPTARKVYNNILHENHSHQAHFGRSGLNMLAFDPNQEIALYLFDSDSRARASHELHQDIPNLIEAHGDSIDLDSFHLEIYNQTAAHSDDIHSVLISNPDIDVLTPDGNSRRSANTITSGDTIRLKKQTSFFPLFSHNK